MENLTMGEIAKALTFLVGLISSVVYLKKGTVKSIINVIDERRWCCRFSKSNKNKEEK